MKPLLSKEKRKNLVVILIILYILLSITPLTIATFTHPITPESFYKEFARSIGLIAVSLYGFQLTIAVRLKLLDRVFGLDRLFIFHRRMGGYILLLILIHPVLMSIHAGNPVLPFDPENPWNIWAGFVAIIILLLHILLSIYRPNLKINWEAWRIMHDIYGLTVLFLILLHSWFTGDDLKNPVMQAIWVMIPLVGIGLFVWHRWIRYGKSYSNHFIIEEVIREAEGVHTVKMRLVENEVYNYIPGQFHFIRFFGKNISDEEHHFTISSSPTQDFVSSTIKKLGDFTGTIKNLKPGDKAIANGPFGQFSYLLNESNDEVIMIAGGIGITPLMSMIKHMKDTEFSGKVMLLYASKDENNIIFKKELDQIESENRFLKVVHVIQDPQSSWKGEKGRIDQELISKYVTGKISDKQFYICGPAPMITSMINILKDKGADPYQLHSEIFELAEGFIPQTRRYTRLINIISFLMFFFVLIAVLFGIFRTNGV